MNVTDTLLAVSGLLGGNSEGGGGGGGGGEAVLVNKTVSANGTYLPSADNADGYKKVTVNVPNTYAASDEGKVVSNGALVSQTSQTVTENGTYDTTTKNEVVVNVAGASIDANIQHYEYVHAENWYTESTAAVSAIVSTYCNKGKGIYWLYAVGGPSTSQYRLDGLVYLYCGNTATGQVRRPINWISTTQSGAVAYIGAGTTIVVNFIPDSAFLRE